MFEKIKLSVMDKALRVKAERELRKNLPPKPNAMKNKIYEPNDYVVFKKICSGTSPLVFNVLVIVAALTMSMVLVFNNWQLVVALLAGLFLLQMLQLLINQLRYKYLFQDWHLKLPFKLTGWDVLVNKKAMYCDLCWNDTSIEIKSFAKDQESRKNIRTALSLLCHRANKAFYEKEIGTMDKRITWKLSDDFSAHGSTNPDVMKRLKKTLQGELSYLAKRNSISEVIITVSSTEYEIPIEIPSSEGTAS